MNNNEHYLKKELYELVEVNSSIFEFIQEGSLDGIWYWDLQQPENEWLSERFWTLLGYDPLTKQHLASEWQEIINQDDLTTAIINFNAHCADPNHPYDQVVRYIHKNGSTIWVRCRGIAIRDENGNAIRMLGAHTDITALKESEQALKNRNLELQIAQKKAEAANKSKSIFLSHMSHELRSPLNSVIGFAEILKSEAFGPHADSRYQEYAQQIFNSGNHLLSLIGDILDLSKIESGGLELELQNFKIQEVLNEVINLMQARALDKGIELSLVLPSSLDLILKGDTTRIKQILVNLIDNALKFTHQGSVSINVKLLQIKSNEVIIEVSVSDTGIGIEKEKLDHMFNPFTQADLSTTRHFGGTGLGLSICKKLVEVMSGEINVESIEGQGSCFSIKLPLEISNECQADDVFNEKIALKSLSILLVDDMDINLIVTRAYLENDKHQVITAKNGIEAIESIQNSYFDLVLMDIHMPKMDGIEATRHIRSDNNPKIANIPVFALTADVMSEQKESFIKAGMNGCLSKPIQLNELRRAINTITT